MASRPIPIRGRVAAPRPACVRLRPPRAVPSAMPPRKTARTVESAKLAAPKTGRPSDPRDLVHRGEGAGGRAKEDETFATLLSGLRTT